MDNPYDQYAAWKAASSCIASLREFIPFTADILKLRDS